MSSDFDEDGDYAYQEELREEIERLRAALLAVETDHTDRCLWCRAGRGPDPKTGWHTGQVMHLPTCQRQVALGLAQDNANPKE